MIMILPDETTSVCSPKCLEKKRNDVNTAISYLEPSLP